MAQNLATTGQGQHLTQWRRPSLTAALNDLVESRISINQMPVVGPNSANALRIFADHPEPPMATEEWIEAQIGMLSIKPQRGRNALEAKALIEVYVPVMLEFSQVDIGYAVGRLIRENKWFPDIAEIVELAKHARARRNFKRVQAKLLIAKHERDWTAPLDQKDMVLPNKITELLSDMNKFQTTDTPANV